jgi:hypothetical protein
MSKASAQKNVMDPSPYQNGNEYWCFAYNQKTSGINFLQISVICTVSTQCYTTGPLLKLDVLVRAISAEITFAVNPLCFCARVFYVHTPGTHPPQCKAYHDSLNVLPKLETSQEIWSNILHMGNYCPTSPQEPVPHSFKCLLFPSPSQGHSETQGTYMNGTQALKVGAVSHSEKKCCKKDYMKHTYKTNHY